MKKSFPLLVFLSVSVLAFGQTHVVPKNKSVKIDGYAARVNDRVITQGEVWQALAPILPELQRTYQGAQLQEAQDKAYTKARDGLVERALIMEAFRARGGQIPDQYVNDAIKREINDRFKGDEVLFEQLLTTQKKTRVEYMEILREQMAVDMLMGEEVVRRARVTPAQVKAKYETSKALYFIPEKVRHSVILLNKGATEEDRAVKRKEAESILQRLAEGADFSTVAKELSEGSRAAEGGKFPWMQPKDVRPELRDTLKTLPAGEVSGIIEADTELYIVTVSARRQPSHKSFDEVREAIKAALNATERERLKARWIARLKENNYVVIYE
jgi:parvulin-like peptidyl-prolyl isomerase